MTRCKPDPAYYRELLSRLSLGPAECIMVGNDPRKDLPARDAGIRTFLVDLPGTRAAIEAVRGDPRLDATGTFEDLRGWIRRSGEARCQRRQSSSA
jgi:FMN phosphatase YigB (HAD superfamily)